MQYAAQNYGRGKKDNTQHRKSQLKYREELYNEFHHCPFTQIDEFRLLVASHIKPYSHCKNNEDERFDVNNGLLLSKDFDSLFDLGYMTFNTDGEIIPSDVLGSDLKNHLSGFRLHRDFINHKRMDYMRYHRNFVFNKRFSTRNVRKYVFEEESYLNAAESE